MTIGRPDSAGSTTEWLVPTVEVEVSLLPCLLVKMLEPEVERVPSVEFEETRLVVVPALKVSGFESARRPKTWVRYAVSSAMVASTPLSSSASILQGRFSGWSAHLGLRA
jgi:hypothetical protein